MRHPTSSRRKAKCSPTRRIGYDPIRDRNDDQCREQSLDPVTDGGPPTRSRRGGFRKGAGRPQKYTAKDFICKVKDWRTVKDAPPEVVDLADHALQVITDISCGRVRSQIASTQLKAAIQLRLETCEPIPTASQVDLRGGVSLVSILTDAAMRVNAVEPGAIKSLPPSTPEELENLAKQIGYRGDVEHVAAVLARDAEEGSKLDGESEAEIEAETEATPTETEDPPPPPNLFGKLIPPYSPEARIRADAPHPTRGRFVTADNTPDDED